MHNYYLRQGLMRILFYHGESDPNYARTSETKQSTNP